MSYRNVAGFGLLTGIALFVSMGVASAACSGTTTITCTAGPAAGVHPATGVDGPTHAATPYPTSITVSGAAGGSTVSTVSVTLSGYTATTVNGAASRSMGLLLSSPSGRNLEIMRSVGRGGVDTTNATITIQDGSPAMPSACQNVNALVGGTFAPSAYGCSESGNAEPNYTVSGGPALLHSPQTNGTSTLNSTNGVFNGDTPNGAWSLYLVDDSGFADVNFTSWTIVITVSAASTPSTTTLTPNPTTAYRTAPNNSVVLTATVTAGATGTILFKDGATNLTCTEGANPRPVSSNQAVCTTTFSTEGIHGLSANYSGDSTFVSSAGTANVYIQNHATNTGTTYCNAGPITNNGRSDLAFSNTGPYPSVIFVGDGVNTDIANSVNTVSVSLKNFSSNGTTAMHMLLMAPDGTHAYDFWSNVGSTASAGDYNIVDGSPQLPNSALSPGTYGPTADGTPPDPFTPGPPTPAPQLPGSFFYATPEGDPNSRTFQTAFAGAPAHGAWALFLYNGSGAAAATSAAGGWCLSISAATGFPTTVNVTSNPFPFASQGSSVTFTANVASAGHPVPNQGTVTFTENGSPLTGAPNGGVANVVNGVANISTSGLPQGDHTITAAYHDSAATYNDNFGTMQMRVDKATSTPTLSGSTWSYCNTGTITIPTGVLFVNDIGPGTPNPANVFVTNLPGTISSTTVTLKGFTVFRPSDLESLLVGPNGASAPTAAQTLDFFSLTGGINTFGPTDTTFSDTGAVVPAGSPPSGTNAPTSRGATTYTASPFYTLPTAGSLQHATTQGTFTFNTGNAGNPAVYKNTVANGTWSLYFNQLTHSTGSGVNNGWCMNFIENPVTVTAVKSHTGNPPNGHFRQGQQAGASFTLTVTNNGDFQGNGSTGDPDGLHPITVTDVLNSAFTVGTLPTGTPWNCSAVTQTVTCTSSSTIASGSAYPALTIPVHVANNAAASATNQASLTGGGITATNSNIDTVIIDPAPVLAISKAHVGTFTQGKTATWTLQVTNNAATAAGTTDGSTVTVTDTLPAGYTLSSGTGTGWSCSGSNAVTCTSTDVIAGAGAAFPLITLLVNVPANSPASVSNSAKVFGGGDVVHTNAGTAATSNSDVVTVDPAAILAISKAHAGTFTQGQTANWTLQVTNNSATAAGTTDGSTVTVTDTLPAGYTLSSGTGTGWSCSGSNAVTCTSTDVIAGAGGNFPLITLVVNVPANSPTSVSNSAKVFGGGDVVHTNSGTAANSNSDGVTVVQVPATITAGASTTPQSANTGAAFGVLLSGTVRDAASVVIPNFPVSFTAPGSGASGTFANNTNTTSTNTTVGGIATATTFTANATVGGPYNVVAQAGPASVNFALTNTLGQAPNVTGQFTVTLGVIAFNRSTGMYSQPATLVNNGATLSSAALVLDNLAAGATMVGPAPIATTSATSPAGSPYTELGAINSGNTLNIVIQFTRTGTGAITYTPRVLGAGPR